MGLISSLIFPGKLSICTRCVSGKYVNRDHLHRRRYMHKHIKNFDKQMPAKDYLALIKNFDWQMPPKHTMQADSGRCFLKIVEIVAMTESPTV